LRASLKGTTTQSEFEINRAFDEIGATVETVCEPDFFGYLLTSPKESVDEGLRILSDIVLHPSFQIPILNREKQNLLSEIDEIEDHPFLYTSSLLYEAALKNHPYSLPKLGHRWAILKITPDHLIKWHHKMIQSRGMALSAVGDFISLDIRTSMENYFKAIKSTPLKYEEIEEIKPPTFISENFRERTRSLTSMAIGFQTSRLNDAEEAALKLLETLTRDQGGRFGLRLRTQEKMSDEVVCQFKKYLKGGIFTAYTTFVPTDEKNVLRILLEEFKKLKNHLIDKSEFRAAQAVLQTNFLNHLQTSQNKALEYAQTEIYGKPLTAIDEFLERIDQLTLGEINDTAETYFDLEKYTLGTIRGIETKKAMSTEFLKHQAKP
jgi:zinc protease